MTEPSKTDDDAGDAGDADSRAWCCISPGPWPGGACPRDPYCARARGRTRLARVRHLAATSRRRLSAHLTHRDRLSSHTWASLSRGASALPTPVRGASRAARSGRSRLLDASAASAAPPPAGAGFGACALSREACAEATVSAVSTRARLRGSLWRLGIKAGGAGFSDAKMDGRGASTSLWADGFAGVAGRRGDMLGSMAASTRRLVEEASIEGGGDAG